MPGAPDRPVPAPQAVKSVIVSMAGPSVERRRGSWADFCWKKKRKEFNLKIALIGDSFWRAVKKVNAFYNRRCSNPKRSLVSLKN